jgi:hypothetical protein
MTWQSQHPGTILALAGLLSLGLVASAAAQQPADSARRRADSTATPTRDSALARDSAGARPDSLKPSSPGAIQRQPTRKSTKRDSTTTSTKRDSTVNPNPETQPGTSPGSTNSPGATKNPGATSPANRTNPNGGTDMNPGATTTPSAPR